MENLMRNVLEKIKRKEISSADSAAAHAAGALIMLARRSRARSVGEFVREVENFCNALLEARPASAAIRNYVKFLHRETLREGGSLEEVKAGVEDASRRFIVGMEDARRRIAVIGARRIRDGSVVLTHGFGRTVYAVLTEAARSGKHVEVYVTEARPKLEGRRMARLLSGVGIPTTLIVDSAARAFMADVDVALVGAEAIAANGAVVSKIGTSVIAALAHEARVRVMVAAGTHKFSSETIIGRLIEMEEGGVEDVLPSGEAGGMGRVRVRNPLYDATPPDYIDVIVTEEGVIPPQGVYMMLAQGVGWHGA